MTSKLKDTYILVTYGYSGMRGVQTKGIRLADSLIKHDHSVLFYDFDPDHLTLKKSGYNYIDWNFNSLYSSDQIVFPKNTKAVIFLALPTNRIGQIPLFLSAKEKKIPTVIIDNFYRPDQLTQKVFANIIQYSDLVILNGLAKPDKEKIPKNVKVVGPFIRPPEPDSKIKKWLSDIGVKDQKIILGAGYNEDVLKELEILAQKVDQKNVVIFALGASQKVKKVGNLIYLPFLDDQKVNNLLSIATLTIYKFGFIQVVESLIREVPVIVTGGMRGFKSSWLGKEFKNLIFEATNSQQVKNFVDQIINQKDCFYRFRNKIKKIALTDQNSLEIATKLIEKLNVKKSKKIIKELAISFDDRKSLNKLSEILIKKPFCLPIIFAIPALRPKDQTDEVSSLCQFEPTPINEMLQWGFSVIFKTSLHSLHSGAYFLPFYSDLIKSFKYLLLNADKLTYCNREIENFVKTLDKKNKIKP